MIASKEIQRLQAKLADGSLPADEPIFVLRAQDMVAFETVLDWIARARAAGASEAKITEAIEFAKQFEEWPV